MAGRRMKNMVINSSLDGPLRIDDTGSDDGSDARRSETHKSAASFGSSGVPERVSVASMTSAASEWKSSVASFNSSAEGQEPVKVVIGRRALPEKMRLSEMMDMPTSADGTMMSLGSKLHEGGKCTPCKFHRSNRGCKDASLCKLCHFPHEELTRAGVRKAQMRSGLQKRAFFDSKKAQVPQSDVKNTFIQLDQPLFVDCEQVGFCIEPRMVRSASDEALRRRAPSS